MRRYLAAMAVLAVLGMMGAAYGQEVSASGLVRAGDPVSGNPLGDVTVVVFSDTECGACRRIYANLDDLVREDGRVRVVWKDVPVAGARSELELRALLAAGRQGGYEAMRDVLVGVGGTVDRDGVRELAERLGLDGGEILREIDDPAIKARIGENEAALRGLGVAGPAVVVGGRVMVGVVGLGALRGAVEEARRGR